MAKGVKLSAKIALDVVMFLILVLLYKAKVLTLTYHEVAGIGILLVFLIHCLFNWRWIAHNAKKLFSSETPARTKFSYWISIALVVSFLIIVISGVFISKVLFKEQIEALNMDTSIFRTLHLFFSAISLILVGIHLGLYWGMVKGFFRKTFKVSEAAAKPICYVLLAAVVIFGAYSVPTSGFSQWLLCPVIPIEHGHGDKGSQGETAGSDEHESAERGNESGDRAASESTERAERESTGDHEANADEQATAEGAESGERGDREGAERGNDESSDRNANGAESDERADRHSGDATSIEDASEADGDAERANKGDREEAADEEAARDNSAEGDRGDASSEGAQSEKKERSGNHGNNVELSNVLLTIAQFTSIMGLFAAITYYINEALRRRKKTA